MAKNVDNVNNYPCFVKSTTPVRNMDSYGTRPSKHCSQLAFYLAFCHTDKLGELYKPTLDQFVAYSMNRLSIRLL